MENNQPIKHTKKKKRLQINIEMTKKKNNNKNNYKRTAPNTNYSK